MKNEVFNQYIFHYSPYEECWKSCKREHYLELFSNNESKNVLKSTKIDTLIGIINKTNGDLTKLKLTK